MVVVFRRTGEHLALLLLGSAVGAHHDRVVTLVRLQRDLTTDKPTRSADVDEDNKEDKEDKEEDKEKTRRGIDEDTSQHSS